MKVKKMLVGNLNCVFDSTEQKGFFEYWNEFSHQVFTEKYEFPEARLPRYTFLEVSMHKDLLSEPVIIGKFVKITELDVSQEYHKGVLTNVDKKFNSAPSAIFVYLIRNHIFLYMAEHKGSPSIQNFVKYFEVRIDRERTDYVKKLIAEGMDNSIAYTTYPEADISYTGIVSSSKLNDIFKHTKSISDLHISTRIQNGDLIIDGLIGNNQEALKKLRAKRADTKFSYVKSMEGAEEVVKDVVKNGAADFKFSANLYDGTKRNVQNSDIQLEANVEYNDTDSVVDNAKNLVAHLHALETKGEIPHMISTNSQEVINVVFKGDDLPNE